MVCHENWIKKVYHIVRIILLLDSFLKLRYHVYQLVCPLYHQVYNLLYNTITRVKPMRILKHSPVSQCVPLKSATQRHVYELTASVHVAPFLQGLLAHSSISKTSKSERVGQRGGGRIQ